MAQEDLISLFSSDKKESKKEMSSENTIPSLLFKARNDANINFRNYLQINIHDNIMDYDGI